MINLDVPFIRQSFEFDCWYAALRMLVKFRHGPQAEPVGHPHAELEGMLRDSERVALREEAVRNGVDLRSYGFSRKLGRIPPRGLKVEEFQVMAGHNGLCAPQLPPPYDAAGDSGGFTSDRLEALLRVHGPLWCVYDRNHAVVVKGVEANGNLLVHDPLFPHGNLSCEVKQFNVQLKWNACCMMFLPAIPNTAAYAT